jgi:hypothetical protein
VSADDFAPGDALAFGFDERDGLAGLGDGHAEVAEVGEGASGEGGDLRGDLPDDVLDEVEGGVVLVEGGEDVNLVPGEIVFADGASSFGPKNPFDQDFEMLIHLIKR